MDRILEEDGFRLRRLEFTKDAGTAVSDVAPILILFLLFQLDRRQVDDGVCIAGEDARAAAAVGRPLGALRALGVMVAVDDRASQLAADVVELIAEVRHIAGGIFVTRDDLVNRIDDDRCEVHVLTPPDDDLCQLIHRKRLASEIPHDEIAGAGVHRHALCPVDVFQSVDERFLVDFQIDIEDFPLPASPSQKLTAGRNGKRQLHQPERLPRLRGACQYSLVPQTEDAVDQDRIQRRRVIDDRIERQKRRQIILLLLRPCEPCQIILLSLIDADQELLLAVPRDARHAGQAGRVLVLRIDLEAVFVADVVNMGDALIVFLLCRGIDMDDGMHRLPAGVDDGSAWQLHLSDERQLLAERQRVRLHQRIAIISDIRILRPFSVQWIDTDPCPCRLILQAADSAGYLLGMLQRLDDLSARPLTLAIIDRLPFPVLSQEGIHRQPDILIRLEERLQIRDEVPFRVPFLITRLMEIFRLDRRWIDQKIGIREGEPRHGANRTFMTSGGLPPAFLRPLGDDGAGDWLLAVFMERLPLLYAFPFVKLPTPAAPRFPDRHGIALLLESHAHLDPSFIAVVWVDEGQERH